MAVTVPTQSNQFPNVINRTGDYLTAFIDTVPVTATTFAYVADGEWLEEDATTHKYKIPGEGAAIGIALNAKHLFLVTGKRTEPSRQVLALDVYDMTTSSAEGMLPVYKGTDPVEFDFLFYDEGATWAYMAPLYIVSDVDADGVIRCILSTTATGQGGAAGKLVGYVTRTPADNNGFVRAMLNAL